MRIVIASDLHANWEALAALPREYDQLWILGDLVNYGPNPAEVVDYVHNQANQVMRGNHDHVIAFGTDPQCHGRFRELAAGMSQFTEDQLKTVDAEYLRDLPLQLQLQIDRKRFWLCHAIPSNPLFGYAPPDSELWHDECDGIPADILLVGHTHRPFVKQFGNCLVVNPGSLGQPNNRSALACYAVWEDGNVSLRSTAYAVDATVARVNAMPVALGVRQDLVTLLRTGGLPDTHVQEGKQDRQNIECAQKVRNERERCGLRERK